MRIRMEEGTKKFLEALGMIKPVKKPGGEKRSESPTPFNRERAEEQFIQYGDTLHSLSQSLADILSGKQRFFNSHLEISEGHYQDLKQGGKPDFDKDAALVQSNNLGALSPDEMDIQWQEQIAEFATILEDVREICQKHPEMQKTAGDDFLNAAQDFLQMFQTAPGTDLESQARLLTAVEKVNQHIQP